MPNMKRRLRRMKNPAWVQKENERKMKRALIRAQAVQSAISCSITDIPLPFSSYPLETRSILPPQPPLVHSLSSQQIKSEIFPTQINDFDTIEPKTGSEDEPNKSSSIKKEPEIEEIIKYINEKINLLKNSYNMQQSVDFLVLKEILPEIGEYILYSLYGWTRVGKVDKNGLRSQLNEWFMRQTETKLRRYVSQQANVVNICAELLQERIAKDEMSEASTQGNKT